MPDIIDISPTRSNAQTSDVGHSVTGRMLSIACSEDGQELYAGSYSNLWQLPGWRRQLAAIDMAAAGPEPV